MRKTVSELMSVDFVTVTVRMSLEEARSLLVESDATELCVVDDEGRFEGIVTDYDLLKLSLHGDLRDRSVGSSISRAVTLLSPETLIDQAVPLFREGSCSRTYVCRNGQLLGRLSRSAVLKYLAQKDSATDTPPVVRALAVASITSSNTTVQPPEATPRAPQFLAGLLPGGLCVERPCAVGRATD